MNNPDFGLTAKDWKALSDIFWEREHNENESFEQRLLFPLT